MDFVAPFQMKAVFLWENTAVFMKKQFCLVLMLCLFLQGVTQTVEARKFRILSFNIAVDKGEHWNNRKVQVGEFIKRIHPDVFGLQESTKMQMDEIAPYVSDYSFVGVARDDGKESGEYSPVYFRKDLYMVLKSGTFWLSETPEEPSLGWDANCRRVCSWALLQEKTSGRQFVFANTHLDHIGKKARKNGVQLIKDRLSGLVPPGVPLMVTGDFNVTDKEESYQIMTSGRVTLGDAYKMAKKREGMKSSFHDWGRIPDSKEYKIDFIFVSPWLKVKKAVVYDGALGNGIFLSDHHPHYADLKW